MQKIINHIILILCISLFSRAALASVVPLDMDMHKKLTDGITNRLNKSNSKTIEVSYQKQLSLNVADEAINRINFKPGRVSKIIGNVSGFTSILSDDGNNLFITPKEPNGSKIGFAVLLSSGDIIDMSLTVVKSKKPYLISLNFSNNQSESKQSEASLLIDAMRSSRIGKYYVQTARSNVTIPGNSKIKATSSDLYKFGALHGTTLTLQNKTKRTRKSKSDSSIEITENDLIKAFKGVVGVHIENTTLGRGETTKAYIVFKEAV